MNGELKRMADLVLCTKEYLRTKIILLPETSYISSSTFRFTSKSTLLGVKTPRPVTSVPLWLKGLSSRGFKNIRLHAKAHTEDLSLLGFANMEKGLSAQYADLSQALYAAILQSLLYAINQW